MALVWLWDGRPRSLHDALLLPLLLLLLLLAFLSITKMRPVSLQALCPLLFCPRVQKDTVIDSVRELTFVICLPRPPRIPLRSLGYQDVSLPAQLFDGQITAIVRTRNSHQPYPIVSGGPCFNLAFGTMKVLCSVLVSAALGCSHVRTRHIRNPYGRERHFLRTPHHTSPQRHSHAHLRVETLDVIEQGIHVSKHRPTLRTLFPSGDG